MNRIEAATTLQYLGHTITYNISYWGALYSNLRKSQRIWGVVEKVLGKTGAPIKSCEMMYKAAFHAVFLYDSTMWVVTDAMMRC